jgi:transposase
MVPQFEPENLKQLPTQELVAIILEQQRVIEQLMQAMNRLQVSQNQDSQTSSKPPSADLLKKTETAKTSQQAQTTGEQAKRKPGGQPGHPGKTSKGFGTVERYEILRPQVCPVCGCDEFVAEPVRVKLQQVAQLVERPIEIVEYQQHSCECRDCGQIHRAAWPESIVPGQDLGVSLQALLVWLGNYGHLSYEKQQELLRSPQRWHGHRRGYSASHQRSHGSRS